MTLAVPPYDNSADGRLRRLEALDALLPALADALDIRDVFEQVSTIARGVIQHDMLSLLIFSPDKASVVPFAVVGGATTYPPSVPVPDYLRWMVDSDWDHVIREDVQTDPQLREIPPVRAGYRGVLSVPIRLRRELVGTMDFWSMRPNVYRPGDVLPARRIADHMALALSHQRLAEQARSHEELRARTASLELLDERLTALEDAGEAADVFDRIMAMARKVLPHDAALLAIDVPDARRSRVYTTRDFPADLSGTTTVPVEPMPYPNADHELLEEIASLPQDRHAQLASLGFRSLLAMPIRIDGRSAAALTFLSNTSAAFRQADVPVARRVADRLAVTVARDRAVAASRRADEATARADEAQRRAGALEARVNALAAELNTVTGYRFVIGQSPPWKQVLKQATQVAATDTTTLLLGESGTGKEVVARFIHRASTRSGGPFVALNCAALPEPLLESELFGFERGAFTGALQAKPGQLEQAAGGVLFLDEVGEMSAAVQAKFLRVLQEREFQRLGGTRTLKAHVRVVAATNRNLRQAMERGAFREDLYYRLNVFEIHLPPLRDRKDDVLPLSDAFLKDIAKAFGRPPAGVAKEAREALVAYHWPGNVRELRNVLERAAILCEGGLITTEHLTFEVGEALGVDFERSGASARPSEPGTTDLRVIEKAAIERALVEAKYNKSLAAQKLGLTRKQLYVRLRQHGIE